MKTSGLRRAAFVALGATGLASIVSAQASFSVDWHSPTVGMPDTCAGFPITEGDILVPFGFVPALGPLPAPCISISAGPAGLGLFGHPGCVGHPGGTPCTVELDALSYGLDTPLNNIAGAVATDYIFSTDEYAMGGVAPVLFPSVGTEAPCGDSSTDVWRQGGTLPPGPLPPFAAPVGHIGMIDGDGLLSCTGAVYPGTGLIEPNFPGFPNLGDNLDAIDWNEGPGVSGFPATGVYYSLDAAYFDLFAGVPNTGSALFHGFTGADVLWSPAPGGPPILWAPGPALGLNIAGGEDDLDALALWENGSGAFEPSVVPYDWMTGASDMLLFSVRRHSPVVGMPDSIFGIPISEGDILTTPLPTSMGGVSPFPGIICAGENIGLAVRTPAIDDDLNALDVLRQQMITDCNGNGVDDSIDIAGGTSSDINGNGIPDECEIIGGPGCFCPAPLGPCGNNYAPGGCRNSTGVGGLLAATGSGSVSVDNLVLTATQLPPNVFGVMFGGTAFVGPLPFGDGLRCAGGNIVRFTTPTSTGPTGTLVAGPGLAGGFGLVPFVNWTFQCWYRDVTGPCGNGFNTSHSQDVFLTP